MDSVQNYTNPSKKNSNVPQIIAKIQRKYLFQILFTKPTLAYYQIQTGQAKTRTIGQAP